MNVLTGRPAKSNDPSTWTDYQTAVDLVSQRGYAGVSFMFQPPYVGVDIDHCVKDGTIAPYALQTGGDVPQRDTLTEVLLSYRERR